jgi:precorrin-8X/cobalt-precorrin-8 methylmutase
VIQKANTEKVGVLLISHGSPRDEANDAFAELTAKVATRLDSKNILPTFFSIKRPNIMDQVGKLAQQGIKRIIMLPYFLGNGQHIRADIPAQLEQCSEQYPEIEIEFLSTLQGEPGVEDVLTERLMPYLNNGAPLPSLGGDIAKLSHNIIDRRLSYDKSDDKTKAVIRRVIHATADFSFAQSMRISPDAIEKGCDALNAGCPIICDVNMVKAGMTSVDNEILCKIKSEDVIKAAKEKSTTRAAAAMEKLQDRLQGSIVVIGNAPTALFKIMEIAASGGPKPALVIGLPVGSVGPRESKLALIDSGLSYITNTNFRGGSPVAAAALNAVAYLRKAACENKK